MQVKPYIRETAFCEEEVPLLTAAAQLPHWDGRGGRPFNRYYRSYSRAFLHYCREELFPQVRQQYRQARESGGPLPRWQVTLDTAVTLETPRLLSLYTDSIERGGPQRAVLRRGDTWDLRWGCPMALPEFFPARSGWRRRLAEAAAAQIQQEEAQGISLYYPDWPRRLRRAFSPRNFYLTEEGLCFFYQMYAIAPAAEGIPTFCLPYDAGQGPFPPAHFAPGT
jgi:hypothetical protein